jgi:hypothetical protein
MRVASYAVSAGFACAVIVACSTDDTSPSSDDASLDQCAEPEAGSTNYALLFDGLDDYASTGTAGFPAGNMPQTISLWVLYASASGTQAIVTLRSDFASGVMLGFRDGILGAFPVYTLNSRALVAAPTPPPPLTWFHLAYVYDGTTAYLYIDGAAVATSAASPNIQIPTTSWLGSIDGYNDFFAGEMDEIRIWSIARKASDVLADMQGTVLDDAPGLVAYFDCNEVCGTRMPDQSGNGNDATLGGGDPTLMPQLIPASIPPDS